MVPRFGDGSAGELLLVVEVAMHADGGYGCGALHEFDDFHREIGTLSGFQDPTYVKLFYPAGYGGVTTSTK